MSNEVDVQRREFAGFRDPGLPIGTWQGFVTVGGDASGGVRQALVTFKQPGDPLSGNMYSLDQLTVQDSDEATKFLTVTAANMDPLRVGPIEIGIGQSFACQLIGVADASAGFEGSRIAGRDVSQLPMWLGRALDAVNNAQLRLFLTNVDLALMSVGAQGYIWGPRSITADGGPRRPVSSMYRP